MAIGADQPQPAANAVNRVRYFPAPNREQAMVGGKITGSNVSEREGFESLAEITIAPPAGQWSELTFSNTKLYRWIRYEAPAGSHGNVAELEFYAGEKRMNGHTFGSFGWRDLRNWPRAVDGKTDTWFDSDEPDGQYVGLDIGEAVTAQMPRLDPPPRNELGEVKVALHCNTPGAVIRFSLTAPPGPNEGEVYSSPIPVDVQHTTIFAVAFKEGMAPSPVASGNYLGNIPLTTSLTSLHVGNSLTGSLHPFPDYVRAAGFAHDFHSGVGGGQTTQNNWDNIQSKNKADWDKELASMPRIDHFSVQPRLRGFTDADLANEAKVDALFFDAVRANTPEVQPWIYSEWPSRKVGFNGWPPPAANYAEACAALMATTETIERKVRDTDKAGKQVRILPCTLAVAHLKMQIEAGQIPALSANDFDPIMFYDNVHPGDAGRYLLCMVWYAAFYGKSPVGKIPPLFTNLTAEQADALQRLAWDVVKNYPDCGLYEEGKQPCAKPEIATGTAAKLVALKSATPGAWFRYTFDGTIPTRTTGYVYCGAFTLPPGAHLKAVAYKSGMADSEVVAQ